MSQEIESILKDRVELYKAEAEKHQKPVIEKGLILAGNSYIAIYSEEYRELNSGEGLYIINTTDGIVGQGASGKVYKARPVNDEGKIIEKYYALKVIPYPFEDFNPDNKKYFEDAIKNETQNMKSKSSGFNHTSTIFFPDTEYNYVAYILTDFIEGIGVHELPDDLSFLTRTRIAREAAMALLNLHTNSLFHKDIKVDNMKIRLRGKKTDVYFIDYGLSQRVSEFEKKEKTTHSGTINHLAPEIFDSKGGLKSDIYAFGPILGLIYGLKNIFLSKEKYYNNQSRRVKQEHIEIFKQTLYIYDDFCLPSKYKGLEKYITGFLNCTQSYVYEDRPNAAKVADFCLALNNIVEICESEKLSHYSQIEEYYKYELSLSFIAANLYLSSKKTKDLYLHHAMSDSMQDPDLYKMMIYIANNQKQNAQEIVDRLLRQQLRQQLRQTYLKYFIVIKLEEKMASFKPNENFFYNSCQNKIDFLKDMKTQILNCSDEEANILRVIDSKLDEISNKKISFSFFQNKFSDSDKNEIKNFLTNLISRVEFRDKYLRGPQDSFRNNIEKLIDSKIETILFSQEKMTVVIINNDGLKRLKEVCEKHKIVFSSINNEIVFENLEAIEDFISTVGRIDPKLIFDEFPCLNDVNDRELKKDEQETCWIM